VIILTRIVELEQENAALRLCVGEFEVALEEIASYEGEDSQLDINARNMRQTAREALKRPNG
jgi:hypothetical protein